MISSGTCHILDLSKSFYRRKASKNNNTDNDELQRTAIRHKQGALNGDETIASVPREKFIIEN